MVIVMVVMVLVMLMMVVLVVLMLCFFRDNNKFQNAFHKVFQMDPS